MNRRWISGALAAVMLLCAGFPKAVFAETDALENVTQEADTEQAVLTEAYEVDETTVVHVQDNGYETAYLLTLENCPQNVGLVRFLVSCGGDTVAYNAKKDVNGRYMAVFDMNHMRKAGNMHVEAQIGFMDGTWKVTEGTDFTVSHYSTPEQSKTNLVSVMGDSVSTYDTGDGKNWYQYYTPETMDISRTWWMQYINAFGMKLGYDEAIGGSTVAWNAAVLNSGMGCEAAMSSDERIKRLGTNGTPDEILFFGGLNDIFQQGGVSAGKYSYSLTYDKVDDFTNAYYTAIMKMKFYYPNADILCIIPYYTWATNVSLADACAESIISICKEQNLAYVDLRKSRVTDNANMCSPDYLHVNEKGMDIIAKNAIAVMRSNKIKRTQSGYWKPDAEAVEHFYTNDGQLVRNSWIYDGVYRFFIQNDGTPMRNAVTYDQAGKQVFLDEYGHVVENQEESAGSEEPTVSLYQEQLDQNGIVVGMVTSNFADKSNTEYRWLYYEGDTWKTARDWEKGNEWLSWKPEKFGDYVLVGQARIAGDTSVMIQTEMGFSFHPDIKGICQMPYTGDGGGYLIGMESYNNRGYSYEMLILDCTLLAEGKDAWTYTTGKCGIDGNAFWTVWQPEYGYYWTLFRVYDGNGNLIDEKCYGFQNI